MDSLMMIEQYAAPSNARRTFREDASLPTDRCMSPTTCRAFEDEYRPLRASSAATSVPSPSPSPTLWNAAAVFNKALYALKGSKQPIRLSGTTKGGKLSASADQPRAPSAMTTEVRTSEVAVAPQHVLLTSEAAPFSDECCSIISASCNRRSGARRSLGDAAAIPAERGRVTSTSTSPTADPGSPFHSANANPLTPRDSKQRGLKRSPGKTSHLLLLGSPASSPRSCAPSPPPSSSTSAAVITYAASSSSPATPAVKLAVGQAAATSVTMLRKAISEPLQRVGVVLSPKCKEKQE